MVSLDGRTVVVTGAGRGMGAGIATALAEAGARLVLFDAVPGSAEATAARLGAAGFTGDVRDEAAIDRAIEMAAAAGGLDGWVNNAGVITMGPAISFDAGAWDAEVAVNTTAVFRCCQAAARWWQGARRGGAIVNIASYAGKDGYGDMIAYNVSKAGVINLTRNLAHEWAPLGINVNCICPSGVDTPMLDAVAEHRSPDDPASIRSQMVAGDLGRPIQPVEIGRVVAFLLSDAARVIRGQAISVDGGESPY